MLWVIAEEAVAEISVEAITAVDTLAQIHTADITTVILVIQVRTHMVDIITVTPVIQAETHMVDTIIAILVIIVQIHMVDIIIVIQDIQVQIRLMVDPTTVVVENKFLPKC